MQQRIAAKRAAMAGKQQASPTIMMLIKQKTAKKTPKTMPTIPPTEMLLLQDPLAV